MSWKNTLLFQTALCVLAKLLMRGVGQIIHLSCVCVCVFDVVGARPRDTPRPTTHTHTLTNYVGMVAVAKATVPSVRAGWVQLVFHD